ncbi:MAG: response regulator [Alphaproteobacteria bacterium]|nr:response regulator [Alphaproteobacteria bacterium]MBT4083995.1 response regulator [Alphaproteobacteria bacterium]MBT4546479.1 response regulator [Alphaproteobacteria bacterium]MBT5916878.1 response regulator [Alphaproteobacteria bacterium]MBT6385668.1 response regulator [Alphaproteobacteria bacterium]
MTATFRDELAAMDILAWLPEAQLIDLAATCVRQVVTSGTAVEFPVRSAGAVFVLLTGALKTVNESELGEADHNPHWFRSGDVFADPETLSHRLSEITLVAEGDCVLACIGTADFRSLMANNLEFSLVLRKHLQDLDAGSTSAQANGHDVTSVTKLINAGMLNLVKQAPAVTEGINISPPKNSINNTVPVSIEQDEVRGRLVLVVEDDPVSQRMIEVQLDGLGYAALMADNGAEGLQIWRTRHIGLVLTDCHMPEMDGYELCMAIREAEEGLVLRTPVIAVTASARDYGDRATQSGMDGLIAKPVDMFELESLLVKWLPGGEDQAGANNAAAGFQDADDTTDKVGPPVVDLARLSETMGSEDPGFLSHNLLIFLETISATPEEIRTLIQGRRQEELYKLAHTAKGAVAIIAARPLTQMLQDLQEATGAADWQAIEDLQPALEQCFSEVEAFIRKFSSAKR